MKKSYYINNDEYLDVTTNKKYKPKKYCELCGASYPLTIHHKLLQNKCIRDLNAKIKFPKTYTQEFINANQKLFTLCLNCHANIHNMTHKRFMEVYNKDLNDYIVK